MTAVRSMMGESTLVASGCAVQARHCEEPKVRPEVAGPMTGSATKQSSLASKRWIASLALAMTRQSLPLRRHREHRLRDGEFRRQDGLDVVIEHLGVDGRGALVL